VGDRVELPGPRPQAEVVELVGSAGVFAAPCIVGSDGNRDGLPTVLLEAMALGTPCVSTDVTGIPEVVRHEQTGLIVPQRDPPALAMAIKRLLDNPTAATEMAARARKLIEREFDARQTSAALRQVFVAAVRGYRREGDA
jgi:colanic acid/amylovoran biosynthesis glycosyltransferase